MSWSDLPFDLTAAKLPGLVLADATLDRRLLLDYAEVLSKVEIRRTTLKLGATFERAAFIDGIEINELETDGPTEFQSAVFPIYTTNGFDLSRIGPEGSLKLSYCEFTGDLAITLGSTSEEQGPLILEHITELGDDKKPVRVTLRTAESGRGQPHFPAVLLAGPVNEYCKPIEVLGPVQDHRYEE